MPLIEQDTQEKILMHASEEYNAFSKLPFIVLICDFQGVIIKYNNTAKEKLNLPSSAVIPREKHNYFGDKSRFKDFIKRLLELKEDQWLTIEGLDIKVGEETFRFYQTIKTILENPTKNKIGFLCLMAPIERRGLTDSDIESNKTFELISREEKEEFRESQIHIKELTTDIGKLLHTYSSTLIHSKHSMDAVLRSLITQDLINPNTKSPDEDQIIKMLRSNLNQLINSIKNLEDENNYNRYLSNAQSMQLKRILVLLKDNELLKIQLQKIAIFREGTLRIKSMISDLKNKNMPREVFKLINRNLEEVLKLCSLITLSHGIDVVLEMESNVDSLRSYILTNVKPPEKAESLDLYDILNSAIISLNEFAAKRNVIFRINPGYRGQGKIKGVKKDLIRAFLNILHNAIKYSWERKNKEKAIVRINLSSNDGNWLNITIENWGVAITEKELKDGLIYQIGYRGIYSSDRQRPGTGLGLYDVSKVIKNHKGIIEIESKPVSKGALDYSGPFITKVSIKLPLDSTN